MLCFHASSSCFFAVCVCARVGGYAHRVSAVQLLQQSEVSSFRESALLVHQSQQAQFLRQRKEKTSCCCKKHPFPPRQRQFYHISTLLLSRP